MSHEWWGGFGAGAAAMLLLILGFNLSVLVTFVWLNRRRSSWVAIEEAPALSTAHEDGERWATNAGIFTIQPAVNLKTQ